MTATGQTPRIDGRLRDDIRLAIETFIADKPKPPSDAIRQILTEYLRTNGYLPV
ncbi:hypothetical protein [Mesorhizobium shangrilense]|uniref:CopG family transcriptional regulator n=1 Tax=Mesorhizobium shangrilense TaxID=460060 RepID=A0ABV2DNE8_9HYPH